MDGLRICSSCWPITCLPHTIYSLYSLLTALGIKTGKTSGSYENSCAFFGLIWLMAVWLKITISLSFENSISLFFSNVTLRCYRQSESIMIFTPKLPWKNNIAGTQCWIVFFCNSCLQFWQKNGRALPRQKTIARYQEVINIIIHWLW